MKKRIVRNIEEKVLRELRSTHTLSELNPEQRKNLHQFCETWADLLKEKSFEQKMKEDLESTRGFVLCLHAKEQAGAELGLREQSYLKAAQRVERREGKE